MELTHDTTNREPTQPAGKSHTAMSWRAIMWVNQLTGLSWAERGVLSKLADHANAAGGSAWPSVKTIAEYGGTTERNVRRTLTKLIVSKLIEADGSRAGGKHPTTYRLVIPAGFKGGKIGIEPPDKIDTDDPGQNEQRAEPPRTKSTLTPDIMSAEPVQEPRSKEVRVPPHPHLVQHEGRRNEPVIALFLSYKPPPRRTRPRWEDIRRFHELSLSQLARLMDESEDASEVKRLHAGLLQCAYGDSRRLRGFLCNAVGMVERREVQPADAIEQLRKCAAMHPVQLDAGTRH